MRGREEVSLGILDGSVMCFEGSIVLKSLKAENIEVGLVKAYVLRNLKIKKRFIQNWKFGLKKEFRFFMMKKYGVIKSYCCYNCYH